MFFSKPNLEILRVQWRVLLFGVCRGGYVSFLMWLHPRGNQTIKRKREFCLNVSMLRQYQLAKPFIPREGFAIWSRFVTYVKTSYLC